MQIKVGKVFETHDGNKVEIIGLSEHMEFVGVMKGATHPVYYDTKGTPVNAMTGFIEENSPLRLVKELSL